MERATYIQLQCALRSRFEQQFTGLIHTCYGPRNDQLPGAVVIGRDDHLAYPLTHIFYCKIVKPQDSCHSRWLYFGGRSEEHTSELQSLMRISYAVFCLKKKTQTT